MVWTKRKLRKFLEKHEIMKEDKQKVEKRFFV